MEEPLYLLEWGAQEQRPGEARRNESTTWGLVAKKCIWGSAHPRVVLRPLLWVDQGKAEQVQGLQVECQVPPGPAGEAGGTAAPWVGRLVVLLAGSLPALSLLSADGGLPPAWATGASALVCPWAYVMSRFPQSFPAMGLGSQAGHLEPKTGLLGTGWRRAGGNQGASGPALVELSLGRGSSLLLGIGEVPSSGRPAPAPPQRVCKSEGHSGQVAGGEAAAVPRELCVDTLCSTTGPVLSSTWRLFPGGPESPEWVRNGIGFSQEDRAADQSSIRQRGGYPTRRGTTPEV